MCHDHAIFGFCSSGRVVVAAAAQGHVLRLSSALIELQSLSSSFHTVEDETNMFKIVLLSGILEFAVVYEIVSWIYQLQNAGHAFS